jgi:hypothetical protein
MIALALWLAASPLVAWLWGRFVRVGMVELQPQHQVQEEA